MGGTFVAVGIAVWALWALAAWYYLDRRAQRENAARRAEIEATRPVRRAIANLAGSITTMNDPRTGMPGLVQVVLTAVDNEGGGWVMAQYGDTPWEWRRVPELPQGNVPIEKEVLPRA